MLTTGYLWSLTFDAIDTCFQVGAEEMWWMGIIADRPWVEGWRWSGLFSQWEIHYLGHRLRQIQELGHSIRDANSSSQPWVEGWFGLLSYWDDGRLPGRSSWWLRCGFQRLGCSPSMVPWRDIFFWCRDASTAIYQGDLATIATYFSGAWQLWCEISSLHGLWSSPACTR